MSTLGLNRFVLLTATLIVANSLFAQHTTGHDHLVFHRPPAPKHASPSNGGSTSSRPSTQQGNKPGHTSQGSAH